MYLRVERHLAAKTGTRFSLPVYSHLCWGYNSYFGGCFSWEFLIVLFSSYVDDIAFYKNLMWGAPVVASSATGTSCPLFCSCFKLVLTFYYL